MEYPECHHGPGTAPAHPQDTFIHSYIPQGAVYPAEPTHRPLNQRHGAYREIQEFEIFLLFAASNMVLEIAMAGGPAMDL